MARDPIDRLRDEMEELFADLWQVPRFTRRRGGFRPAVDVYRSEKTGEVTVVVELPGLDPQRIQILVDDETLLIAGERRRPRCTGRVYQQMEIDYGRFQRQVALGPGIDVEAARASYRRGVLTIVLPAAKKPAPAARTSIRIRAVKR
ncbi:MAG TPA: Hsp20/alpha crystallin family protein [Gaiellaceae bacterium]|nr:Hsp20/alpha crystallin family protein [Gaiellaceae bacterium]